MNKRNFIKTIAFSGISSPLFGAKFKKIINSAKDLNPSETAQNEDFWASIRKEYQLNEAFINLENGYYSMAPKSTLKAFENQVQTLNLQNSYYMRTKIDSDKIKTRKQLAELVGCNYEELIITRNTTESLDTVIAGYDWKPGDEALMAKQDYGAMLDMFKLQARRYGMINQVISLPNHPKSDDEIIELYANAITPKTRLLMVCHMINITGQILPVKKICEMAHSKGVDVMVDGAHAINHIDFKISDLDCDYYGSSLHKWLSVPLGTGLLYVKKEKIKSLWPVFADSSFADDDIRKLNHSGTYPIHTELTISSAIDFANQIGIERKEARLRFLQQYWTKKVRNITNISVNTPQENHRACGIANVGITTMKPAEMAKILLEKYKIWTVAIDYANVQGCRITPNVYTSIQELDIFVDALKEMARK